MKSSYKYYAFEDGGTIAVKIEDINNIENLSLVPIIVLDSLVNMFWFEGQRRQVYFQWIGFFAKVITDKEEIHRLNKKRLLLNLS